MYIETATSKDCRAIAEIHVESWQQAFKAFLPEQYLASLSVAEREAMWLSMVASQPSHLLVARDADQVTGFVAVGPSRDQGAPADCAEVWAIYVKPALWSTGVGRSLWLAALELLQVEGFASVSLWVLASNARAIGFYERAGFVGEPGSCTQFELGGITLEKVRYTRATAS